LVAGILLRWLFNKYVASSVTRLQLWAACLLLPALFAPLFGSWGNRLPAPYPAKPVSFEFFQEKPFAASRFGFLEGEKIEPSGYYVFIIRNGKIERLRSKISRFGNLERGATIQLPVKKGLFGYEVVEWQD
jgi:hypothetical protein